MPYLIFKIAASLGCKVSMTLLISSCIDSSITAFSGRFFAFNTVLIQISSPIGMLIGSSIAAIGIFYPVFLFAGGILFFSYIVYCRSLQAKLKLK